MTHRSPRGWEGIADWLGLFALHARLYRWLGGRLVGRNILLLETVGRRSLRRRCTPLFYARDGDDYFVVASNGGEDRYPGWWYNVRSNPRVAVQVGDRRVACRADEVPEKEAVALWPRLTAVYDGYRRYRAQTTRPLTIFRLRPTRAMQGHRKGEHAWTA